MPETEVPDAIRRLAEDRREARDRRDFEAADRLKIEIEAGGWKVVDRGSRYRLDPIHPDDIVEADRRRHGWSGSVSSRLADPPVGVASVVLLAPDDPDALESFLSGLAASIDDSVQRIVVANSPPHETETLLARLEARWAEEFGSAATAGGAEEAPRSEIVWTAGRFGAAAALNAGIRRAESGVVIVLDAGIEIAGDFVSPLAAALDDPAIAVAGPWGLVSGDLRRFEAAEGGAGTTNVAAIDGAAMAFRRADYIERGPLDEHFDSLALLDAWWSLVLRDEGPDAPPRRALVVDAPLVRRAGAAEDGATEQSAGAQDRDERRNRYRIIDRFGNRGDLGAN